MAMFLASIRRKLELPSHFKLAHIIYGLSLLGLFVRLALFVIYEPYFEGDTEILVEGVKAIRDCLSEGRLLRCTYDGPFPLFQYVPGIILSYLGFSKAAILHSLAYLSFLGFVASIALVFWTLKRKASTTVAATGALVMLTGPLLWYSHSTYGEMLAAFLILAFTVCSLLRVPNKFLIPLFVLAGVTKEVAFPFLLLTGLLGLLPEVVTAPGKIRGRLYGLAAGAVLTVIATIAFNYFRFALLYNPGYVNELFIVPTLKLQLGFFLAIWFSPAGGLLFFWPSFIFLYFSLIGLLLVRGPRDTNLAPAQGPSQRLIFYLPIITVSLVLVLLAAGFSRWYTPLGGAAWGPRFMLPWIPAATLLLLYFYAQEVETILSRILSKTFGLVLTCISLIIASLPQLMVLFAPFVLVELFAPTPECPRLPMIQEDVVYYYRCIGAQMWPNRLVILESFPVALRPSAFVFTVLYAVILIGACVWIRKRFVKDKSSAETGATMVEVDQQKAEVEPQTRTLLPQGPSRHWLGVLLFFSLLYIVFFSRVLFSGGLLLAPGDGLPLNLPNFFSRKVLWDTLLFGGFPMFADPQIMMWYPLARLFSHIPGSWNVFIILAYIIASFSMYGYMYTVTRSRLSALASGLIYGMSGFMMAHLGHSGIIHSAAWLPLIIWSLEMLRRKLSPLWLVIGSLAVGLCFLAGQSQIFFYSLLLSVAYVVALGWRAPVGRRSFYLYAVLLLGLGVGLAAIQIIPTAELINQSVRREYSFAEFVTFSMPVNQLITLIFPYLYGASERPGHQYFGLGNSTETAAYVGLLSLMLAVIGFAAFRRKPLIIFWAVVAVLGFLLALGYATPLARIMYYVPVMNRFRVPARHFLEMTFAVSVLAGFGISAIRRGKVPARLVNKTILISSLVMLACLLAITASNAFSDRLIADAASIAGVRDLKLLPWANSAVGTPLVIFLITAGGLFYWYRQPRATTRTRLLILVLFLDLASFGWFYEWSYGSPDKSNLTPPPVARELTGALNATHQRFLPVDGYQGLLDNLPPDLSRMWGVPSASGYNVLRLERVSRLLLMYEGGNVEPSWSEPANQSVNLMAVRYVFAPRGDLLSRDRVFWLKKDLDLWIGSGCDHGSTPSLTFDLPKPFVATSVSLVSMLACSTGIPDGTEVARLSVTDVQGRVQTRSLVAGRDSSEWSGDCSNVRPMMRHSRATIFRTYPAKMYDVPCEGHHFITSHALDEAAPVKSISVEWIGEKSALVVQKLSLINGQTKTSYAFNPEYLDSSRWRLADETDKVRLYENLRAMPRAWLAHDMALVKPEEALQIIKSSKLMDERDFDLARTALVEEPLSLPAQERDPNASAEVLSVSDTTMEVRTSSASPSILVTSDPYYPGWGVSIDGQRAHLFRADYAIRGVQLPAGQHLVRFEFKPKSFYYGVAISVISLLALVVIFSRALILIARRKRLLSH